MKKLIQIACSIFIAYTMTACVGAPIKGDTADKTTVNLLEDMNRVQ